MAGGLNVFAASRLAPVALALLLVLAGCGGLTGDGTVTTDGTVTQTANGTETPTSATNGTGPRYDVTIENGTLPVDEDRTYARVQSLVGTDVRPQPVTVRNLSEWRGSLPRVGASPLNRALGFENTSVDWDHPTGVTRGVGSVYVHPGAGTADQVERVLVHEYAHMLQIKGNMLPWVGQLTQPRLTTDRLKTRRSLVEGGAVFVADAYSHRYLDARNNSAFVREIYETETDTHRSALAPYLFGSQYVAHEIDDPADLRAVYESHPQTTEQIIHNYSRAEEPPATLTVETTTADADWAYEGNNTLGEMTTRGSLGTELDRSRAATAAAGWGTDELAIFSHATADDRYGWVWVHRWDDASEADEAAAALEAYADRRGESGADEFAFTRVSDGTTALTFGDPAFVSAATVSGTTGNVSVAVDS